MPHVHNIASADGASFIPSLGAQQDSTQRSLGLLYVLPNLEYCSHHICSRSKNKDMLASCRGRYLKPDIQLARTRGTGRDRAVGIVRGQYLLDHGWSLQTQSPAINLHITWDTHWLQHFRPEHTAISNFDPFLQSGMVAEDLHTRFCVGVVGGLEAQTCLLYTSPSPRDQA